jgi:hypothetical protein
MDYSIVCVLKIHLELRWHSNSCDYFGNAIGSAENIYNFVGIKNRTE